MRLPAFLVLAILSLSQVGRAEIIFTLQKDVSGPIALGDSAVFNLLMRSTVALPAGPTGVAGIDFSVDAVDPGGSTTQVVGGRFISGVPNLYFDVAGASAFQLPFPTSFQYFTYNNGGGLALGTSNVTVATFTLSTLGATPGNYQMGLANLAVVDPGFNSIAIGNASTQQLAYTITAVPEPSVLCLFSIGLISAFTFLRKRHTNLPT